MQNNLTQNNLTQNIIVDALSILLSNVKKNSQLNYLTMCYLKNIHALNMINPTSVGKKVYLKHKPLNDSDIDFVINISAKMKKNENDKTNITDFFYSFYFTKEISIQDLQIITKELNVISKFVITHIHVCFNDHKKLCESIDMFSSKYYIGVILCESDIDDEFFTSKYMSNLYGIVIKLCNNVKEINICESNCVTLSVDRCYYLRNVFSKSVCYFSSLCCHIEVVSFPNLQHLECVLSYFPFNSLKKSEKLVNIYIEECGNPNKQLIKNSKVLNIELLKEVKNVWVINSDIEKINIGKCEKLDIENILQLKKITGDFVKYLKLFKIGKANVEIKKVETAILNNCDIRDENLIIKSDIINVHNCYGLSENHIKRCKSTVIPDSTKNISNKKQNTN